MSLTNNTAIVNAGYLYVYGARMSVSAVDPIYSIDVSAGAVRNSSNTNDIIIPESISASLQKSGAAGIDVGVVAANTMYAVYVIGSSANKISSTNKHSDYPTAIVLSKSFDRPVLQRNYDMYRRVGAIVTSNTARLVKFHQTGSSTDRAMWYGTSLETTVVADESPGFTQLSLVNLTPPTNSEVKIKVYLNTSIGGYEVILRFMGAPSASSGQAIFVAEDAPLAISVLSCPQAVVGPVHGIEYSNPNGSTVTLFVAGYVDEL